MAESSGQPLADWEAQVPATLRALAARLAAAGHSAYLVGGSLRDLLLGRIPADWDLATSAVPGEVRQLFDRVIPTGEKHGTMTVVIGDVAYEVTTLREDGVYSDRRRPDRVEFTSDLEVDLRRRDFTINAMALDLSSGALVDPSSGRADLAAGMVRAVGDPDRRFAEDALRLLRAARFAAQLGFTIDEPTRAAMQRRADLIKEIAPERVREELMALLAADRPALGIALLSAVGVLAHLIPELEEGIGVTQNRFHRYDVFTHVLFTVNRAPAGRPRVRLAALLHDLAKPRTRELREGEATFYEHDKIGAEMVDTIMKRLRFSNAERLAVVGLVKNHLILYSAEWSDAAVRRLIRRVGEENLPDLFALAAADASARGRGAGEPAGLPGLEKRVRAILAARDRELPVKLALDGADIIAALGIAPGPEVGKWLAMLREAVIDDPGRNTRAELLAILRRSAPGMAPGVQGDQPETE